MNIEGENFFRRDTMNIGKITAAAVCVSLLCTNAAAYTAKSGDSYYKISKAHGVNFYELLKANGKNENSGLYVGENVLIPGIDVHIAKEGDSYWKISKQYGMSFYDLLALNGKNESSGLVAGDIVKLKKSTENGVPYVTYMTYSIKWGDDFWTLSKKFGIPFEELCACNSKMSSDSLKEGDVITVPVHHVPGTYAPDGFGEYLDWESAAQYVVPIDSVFTVRDLYTGKTFRAKRTIGANHADCEPLTAADTAAMKEIWGGTFSWTSRPVFVIYNGRTIAASASSMPHAGNEYATAGAYTEYRSGGYGAGTNFDYVKGNNYDGHFDIHFLGSTTHSTGEKNEAHQKNVRIAAGRQ